MDYSKLKEYERITQEMRGNLIKSDNWNNNFNRVSDVIKTNNEILEKNFENIKSENIPSPVIEDLNLPDSNTVYLQLLAIVASLITKADKNTVDVMNSTNFSDVQFNSDTGVFTFTRNNGETVEFDTALEKVPASMSLIDEGNNTYLVITNLDGSTTKTDVTKLLNIYEFIDSDTIKATADGYNVNFTVRPNSITLEMLESNILTDMQNLTDTTKSYMASAEVSANTAKENADKSIIAKSDAEAAANSANEALDIVNTAVQETEDNAILAKSYTKGGTGIRDGENTDNAKYYYENAKAVVNAGGLTCFLQSEEPGISNCIWYQPISEYTENEDVILNTDETQTASTYLLKIEGSDEMETINNVVEETDELTQGKYCFDLI